MLAPAADSGERPWIQDLFDPDRWPRRPYCTDDFDRGLTIRDLRTAITKPYIQANPPHLRIWAIFDVDRAGAAVAWEDAHLPPPTWSAMNQKNGHAHLVWGLAAPVLACGQDARQAPQRYLAAIEAYYRDKLEADRGFSGLVTKNPAHDAWRVLRGPVQAYTLDELAEWLPGIERYIPKRNYAQAAEQSGFGRNVTLFRRLSDWSYRAIRSYWADAPHNDWFTICLQKALEMNHDFSSPLHASEVRHIAKSVSRWTEQRFSPSGFRDWQAAQARKGGLARSKKYAGKRKAATEMREAGATLRAIADQLDVAERSVRRWLPTKESARG